MKSSLATKEVKNTNYTKYTNRNGYAILGIVPHHAAGTSTAVNIAKYMVSHGVSTHYVVDDNDIVACVPEEHGSYACGNTAANRSYVTFEIKNSTGAPNWEISTESWNRAVVLGADILTRHGLGRAEYGKTVRMHRDFVATSCPGPWFASRIQEYCDAINFVLAGGVLSHTTPVASPDSTAANPNPSTTAPTYIDLPLVRWNNKNEFVKLLQEKLTQQGYYTGVIDGDFGNQTLTAVKWFQRTHRLSVDGVVGPQTWKALLK